MAALVVLFCATSSLWGWADEAPPTPAPSVSSSPAGGEAAPAPEGSPSASPSPKAKDGKPTYVGKKACLECHDEYQDIFHRTAHAKAPGNAPDAANQCEACHGPGSVHVDEGGGNVGIISPKRMKPAEVSASCNKCHESKRAQHEWRFSRHASSGVSCTDCHQTHPKKKADLYAYLLKDRGEPKLCYTCHVNVKAEANWPFHHPIEEGRMVCSDCHNVHGGQLTAWKKAPNTRELCLSCHAEFRGPFAVEHQPVSDDCMNCHKPHGSMERNLLTASEPFLCQRCHATVHNPHVPPALQPPGQMASQALFFSRCTVCHAQVHGSENSTTFTR